MPRLFDLQGHRGARGLKPENTLPGFEVAIDLGVETIETDVHLTRDDVPILFHDDRVSERLCRLIRGSRSPDPARRPRVRELPLAQMRGYRADRNPDRKRFPDQDRTVTPLARLFARQHGLDPYTPPTAVELFRFAAAYAGDLGAAACKTDVQRERARRVRFDLELKRVPFDPDAIGDDFDGELPGRLERQVVAAIREAGMVERTTVRSFDHRAVRAIRQLEPGLTTAVLIAGTAPVAPAELAERAGATVYGPEYTFLDPAQVRQCHAAGVRVVPWTVNDPAAWECLLAWGVDGLTTDFPDRLAKLLEALDTRRLRG
jgi:glycerophosphoryl diester phosphodiesterase